MLIDILKSFAVETGYDITQESTRNAAVDYINRAAKEIYNPLECDRLMQTVVIQVYADMQITLPSFVGELRAVREYGGRDTVNINSIGVPRFFNDTWLYRWRNFTLMGEKPICQNITNASILTLNAAVVEAVPAIVSITGKTTTATKISELVVLNATSVVTTNSFVEIYAISSTTTTRTCDITVLDVNGNILAVLENSAPKTRYLLVDVAKYNWSAQTGSSTTVLAEILFKPRLYPMQQDADEFCFSGFDEGILYGAVQLFYHGVDGKEEDVLLYEKAKIGSINRAVSNIERGSPRQLIHQRGPVNKAFFRMRYGAANQRSGRDNYSGQQY